MLRPTSRPTPSAPRPTRRAHPGRHAPVAAQRGVALVFALMGMGVMLVATVAIIRAVDTAQGSTGALAAKRDQVNQSDQGVAAAIALFTTGALSTEAARNATAVTSNYSAVRLPTNDNGIPLALLATNGAFAATGTLANDIAGPGGTSVRYVVDRLCVSGTTAPDIDRCTVYQRGGDKGGSHRVVKAGTTVQWVYRVSVRVHDPRRNSLTFVQTTVGA